jgi:hypothetical protein
MSTPRSRSTSSSTATPVPTRTPRRRPRRRPGGSSGSLALLLPPRPLRTPVPSLTSVSLLLHLHCFGELYDTSAGHLSANALLFCSPRIRWLNCAARAQAISSENASLRCTPSGANQGRPTHSQQRPHRTIARRAACEMSIEILLKNHTDFNPSDQHTASLRSHFARRGNSSQAIWLQRDFV